MLVQRRYPRYDAAVAVDLVDEQGRFHAGSTESISLGGMFVPCESQFRPGERIRFAIDLPSGSEIEAEGTVAYVIGGTERRVTPTSPGVGIRFDSLFGTDSNALSDYIEFLDRTIRGRVLVVDDDLVMANVYRQNLRERQYRVNNVTTAGAAMDIVRFGETDVVVCEVSLPRMDGLELAHAIVELGLERPVRVILLASSPLDEEQRRVAKRLGVAAVLRKPVELDELLDTVAEGLDALEATPITPSRSSEHRRHATIAHGYLKKLGVRTRVSRDGTLVTGDIVFLHHALFEPFQRKRRIPRVELTNVGHDHLKVRAPAPLHVLPIRPFLGLETQADLERVIVDALLRREVECRAYQRWLDGMRITARLDATTFCCVGQVRMDDSLGLPITFRMVSPSNVLVDTAGSLRLSEVLELEDRRVSIRGVATQRELVRRVSPVFEKAVEASDR